HEYDMNSAGFNPEIVASVVDEFGIEVAASNPSSIAVQRHETSLTMNAVLSVETGTDISVSGILTDFDLGIPIQGEMITFDGSGSGGLASTPTLVNGSYSVTGTSPSTEEVLLSVQAHYGGNSTYEDSDSVITTYDTVGDTS